MNKGRLLHNKDWLLENKDWLLENKWHLLQDLTWILKKMPCQVYRMKNAPKALGFGDGITIECRTLVLIMDVASILLIFRILFEFCIS